MAKTNNSINQKIIIMNYLHYLYNRIKCYFNNIGRYTIEQEIELPTGITCVHTKDNWHNTIRITVK